MKWITIDYHGESASGKTSIWYVNNKDGTPLGYIMWHGPWRKYCFAPRDKTIYEQDCLRDIANFCEQKSHAHKLDKTNVR